MGGKDEWEQQPAACARHKHRHFFKCVLSNFHLQHAAWQTNNQTSNKTLQKTVAGLFAKKQDLKTEGRHKCHRTVGKKATFLRKFNNMILRFKYEYYIEKYYKKYKKCKRIISFKTQNLYNYYRILSTLFPGVTFARDWWVSRHRLLCSFSELLSGCHFLVLSAISSSK